MIPGTPACQGLTCRGLMSRISKTMCSLLAQQTTKRTQQRNLVQGTGVTRCRRTTATWTTPTCRREMTRTRNSWTFECACAYALGVMAHFPLIVFVLVV